MDCRLLPEVDTPKRYSLPDSAMLAHCCLCNQRFGDCSFLYRLRTWLMAEIAMMSQSWVCQLPCLTCSAAVSSTRCLACPRSLSPCGRPPSPAANPSALACLSSSKCPVPGMFHASAASVSCKATSCCNNSLFAKQPIFTH